MGGKGEEEKEERKGKGRERGKGEEGEGKQAYTTLQPLLRPSITRKPNDVTAYLNINIIIVIFFKLYFVYTFIAWNVVTSHAGATLMCE